MNKVHEIDYSDIGTSALVTTSTGIKLWRNRFIDRYPFTIDAPYEEYNDMYSFKQSIYDGIETIHISNVEKIKIPNIKVPIITNLIGTFFIMLPIGIISYIICIYLGLI